MKMKSSAAASTNEAVVLFGTTEATDKRRNAIRSEGAGLDLMLARVEPVP